MTVTWTDTAYVGEITGMVQASPGVAGVLNGAKVGLFTNDITPQRSSVIGDFTQPTYPGYVLQAAVWSAARRDELGNIVSDTGLQSWQMTDDTDPTTVLGLLITNTAGTTLLGAVKFDDPVNLALALDWMGTVVEFCANAPPLSSLTIVR